jgi:SAM-dependent methyltransferase
VAQGWERYARKQAANPDALLGDEWNEPEVMGLDVPAQEIVRYLDRRVFEPFLGYCELMLEIGPGGGRFTEVLLPRCKRLLAADTSPTMLTLLRKRFAGDHRLEYLLLDGHGLGGVADKSVDGAFSHGVFVHLQHWDIYNYLVELQRVLKPGGRACIQHANTFSEQASRYLHGHDRRFDEGVCGAGRTEVGALCWRRGTTRLHCTCPGTNPLE